MSHITLIRHGQANSAARDEGGYDKLSELGHRQSAWLGGWLRDTEMVYTRLYTGTLRRHVETAASMEMGIVPIEDERLNELHYFTMAQAYEEQHGVTVPQDREGFVEHLPRVFTAWEQGLIEGVPETYEAFHARVSDALADIAAGDGPALVVTSGGLIATAMRQMLGLDTLATSRMALAIMNTSMHRAFPIGGALSPVMFNAVPHLETPDRQFAQTHL